MKYPPSKDNACLTIFITVVLQGVMTNTPSLIGTALTSAFALVIAIATAICNRAKKFAVFGGETLITRPAPIKSIQATYSFLAGGIKLSSNRKLAHMLLTFFRT
jgi:hypothetical protein